MDHHRRARSPINFYRTHLAIEKCLEGAVADQRAVVRVQVGKATDRVSATPWCMTTTEGLRDVHAFARVLPG